MPHVLCAYVFELTKAFNSLYNSVNILWEEDFWKKNLRILLVDLFAKILKDCFDILAIEMPEEM